MADALREALRERLTLRAALSWLVLLAILWRVLDPSPAQFATTIVSLTVFGTVELLSDVYDLRESVTHVGLGVYAVLGGAAMLAFGDEGALLPGLFVAVGAWFVLDAVQTVRHEGATVPDDTRDGHDVYRDYVARRVHETLADRSLTRRELGDALDADDDAIDDAVARLRDRGVVVREGSELRVRSRERGWQTRTREWAAGVGRRIARPLTLELGRDSPPRPGADRGSTASTAEPAERDGPDRADRSTNGEADDGERERATED